MPPDTFSLPLDGILSAADDTWFVLNLIQSFAADIPTLQDDLLSDAPEGKEEGEVVRGQGTSTEVRIGSARIVII